jgi:hypothetical protein
MESKYPTTKEIIYALGVGTLLAASVIMPGAGFIAKEILKTKNSSDWKESKKRWEKFNSYALRRNLKRLRNEQFVEIVTENGEELIKLTKKGHTKFLKLKIQDLSKKLTKWDGKWRIVIYDVSKFKKNRQSAFRNMIKSMNMLQIQKSVYIVPYPCKEEIEYLREYFDLGDEVMFIRADFIENDVAYKKYFGI